MLQALAAAPGLPLPPGEGRGEGVGSISPRLRTEDDCRRELVLICRRLYDRGYIVATDGNVSVRLPGDPPRMLITPSGACKGELGPEDLIVADMDGRPLAPGVRVSSEVRLHVAAYRERPHDVGCVLHAHPKMSVAFSLAGVKLAQCVLPEILVGLGSIELAPYATPTTEYAAAAIHGIIRTCDAIILDRHGSVTVGATPRAAFQNLERLEWAAEVTLAARQLGHVKELPPDEVERLLAVREKLTGKPRPQPCNLCGACLGCG